MVSADNVRPQLVSVASTLVSIAFATLVSIVILLHRCTAKLMAMARLQPQQAVPPPMQAPKSSSCNQGGIIASAIDAIIAHAPDMRQSMLHLDCVQPQPGELDAKVEEHVRVLRNAMLEELPRWTDAAAKAEGEAHLDPLTLARFVMAAVATAKVRPKTHDDVAVASATFFRRAMSWRAERRVAALFAEFHPTATRPAEGRIRSARQAAAWDYFYSGYGGRTRDGAFFMVEKIGAADHAGLGRSPTLLPIMKDAMLANYELMFRTARASSAATGRLVYGLVVVDVKGVGFGLLRSLELVKYAATHVANNFPEGTQKVLIVNAPRSVATLWNVVSALLPDSIKAKCRLVGESATLDTLTSLIEPSELPAFLGGQRPEASSCVPMAQKAAGRP